MNHLTLKKWLITNLFLVAALALTVLAALNIGFEKISVFSTNLTETQTAILLYSRLPRILLGALVGLALGSGGTAFQALLRNPLADPYILGVSGGAALGAVIAYAFKLPFVAVAMTAFASSFLTMLFIYWTCKFHGKLSSHTLLLTGVIFNAFAFAFIMLIHSLVTMEQAHEILFMLIGNLEIESYQMIAVVALAVAFGFIALCLMSSRLNLISLGDEAAESLGINIDATRKYVFFAASLMIGAVVSVSGLIGFVGLFIPHMVRLLFGSDHRLVLPASGFAGAIFLVWSDTFARTILMRGEFQTQLPVGVITALIGGPMFVYLLKRQMR
ncbi:MAG: iron ABC transporter [Deltaproteobacteria bacterium CG11_big_fil_rev_8_21_14_0_20_49_13]|nr:MAG: iron ABC transporter [Deltaproteobacteria bacterium CG11_big_fil_rev_8_21_14_0_20_49_13]